MCGHDRKAALKQPTVCQARPGLNGTRSDLWWQQGALEAYGYGQNKAVKPCEVWCGRNGSSSTRGDYW